MAKDDNKMATIIKKLDAPINKDFVLTRAHDKLSYIPGYIAIEQANRIFGYFGWGYEITKQPELIKEQDINGDAAWSYTCTVRSWVYKNNCPDCPNPQKIEREDVGFADVTFTKVYPEKDKSGKPTGRKVGGKPQLEVAFKGCVTDALKRALRGWGNQFGNSLYDREDRLSTTQAQQLSTVEETELSQHVQKLLNAKTTEKLEEVLDGLVELAKQDEWKEGQINYIKNVAERRKDALRVVEARKAKRAEDKPADDTKNTPKAA